MLPISIFKVRGKSMEPTFRNGSYVIVGSTKLFKPSIDDVVVIKAPGRDLLMIKRITQIKKNRVYVIGDNEKESTDSRYFGFIDKERIVAKVLFSIS